MDELRRRARLVVVARRADLARERHRAWHEAHLAVLVLHVELDRSQAVVVEARVPPAASRQRCEAEGHVDAADLDRERPRTDGSIAASVVAPLSAPGVGVAPLTKRPHRR